jgi:peptidoglycan-associated lipoprotein
MKHPKLLKLCIVGSTALTLAACSSTHTADNLRAAKPLHATSTSVQNEFGFLSDSSLTSADWLAFCTYYFKFNQTELLGSNLSASQAHGQFLAQNKAKKVLLKGYTDIQGSREYNIGLGYRRAKSVSASLMSEGATKQQIEIVSYGSLFPVAEGMTENAYQKNRRVELVYCEGTSCKSVYTQKALKGVIK